MERLLLVINHQQVAAPAINFACYLARLTHSKLTGLFITDEHFQYIPRIEADTGAYFEQTAKSGVPKTQSVRMDMDQGIRFFQQACEKAGVPCTVNSERGNAPEEVIYESRFADLLIMDPETSFQNKAEGVPTHFVQEVLSHAECPVVIAAQEMEGIDEIVFCYDGSRSSIIAMKQFTYLFPELKGRRAVVVEIASANDSQRDESGKRMLGWLKAHYDAVHFQYLEGDVQDELFTFLLMKKNAFVVMGAYGRSLFSTLFKKSAADVLMRVVDLPLFIAHR